MITIDHLEKELKTGKLQSLYFLYGKYLNKKWGIK